MDWDISVPLFVSVVFWDIVEIVTSDNDGPLHFGGDANSFQYFAPDRNSRSEWAFSVDVLGFDGLFGGSDS